jgi:hypothetical protein
MTDAKIDDLYRDNSEQEMTATRTEILEALCALGICSVCLNYDGYEDEGQIQDIEVSPSGTVLPKDLEYRLNNFGFDFIYDLNDEFDAGHGSYGKLTWDLNANSLKVEHNQYHLECETTHYEGL